MKSIISLLEAIFQKKVATLIIIILLTTAAYLPLRFMNVHGYNFWMDWGGSLDLPYNLERYSHLWDPNNLGQPQFTSFPLFPFYLFVSGISLIFGQSNSTFMVLFFINLITLALGYILCMRYLNDKMLSLLCSLLFVYNPIYLRNLLATSTVSVTFSTMGILLGFIFFSLYSETKQRKYIIFTILCSLLIVHPFYFIIYLFLLAYLYFIEFDIKTSTKLFIGIFMLAIFWLVPVFIASTEHSSQALLGNRIDSVKLTLDRLSGLNYSFLFTVRGLEFIKNIYLNYYLLAIIWIAFFYFFFFRNKAKSYKSYLLVLPLLAMILFSAGGSKPFGLFFNFLWNHLPLMNFFRSYSNILFIVWYYLLFLSLVYLKELNLTKGKGTKYLVSALLIVYMIPIVFMTGVSRYGGTTEIPKEYFELRNLINKDHQEFNIFQMPHSTYDFYSWDSSGKDKYLLKFFFDEGIITSGLTLENSSITGNMYYSIHKYNNTNFIGAYNVKYVIFRKDLLFENKSYYLPANESIFSLHNKLESNDYFDVFEISNDSFVPIIYATDKNRLVKNVQDFVRQVETKEIRPSDTVSFIEPSISRSNLETLRSVDIYKKYNVETWQQLSDPSFENGFWQPKVGDCCKTDPNASKVYASLSTDSIAGKYSLNLTSESQCACVSQRFQDFSNSDPYHLMFNYKGDNPGYCVWVTGDNTCTPRRFFGENDWSEEFTSLYFTNTSTSASLFFYANSPGHAVTNLYDNVRLYRTEFQPEIKAYHPELEFIKVDATMYKISINDARQPFFLIFSESYDQNWKAYLTDSNTSVSWLSALYKKHLEEDKHFIANSYANSWYLNQTGTYKVTLYYEPQSYFYLGVIISGITLIILVGYLIFDWNRNRQKKQTQKPQTEGHPYHETIKNLFMHDKVGYNEAIEYLQKSYTKKESYQILKDWRTEKDINKTLDKK